MKTSNKIIFLAMTFVMSVSIVTAKINSLKYTHTIELNVTIIEINQRENTIVYEYQGNTIKSKYTVNGYFESKNNFTNLKGLKLNQDYIIMLEFPVNQRNGASKNLNLGKIVFIGKDVYSV